ncbi:ARL8A protein, partial [Polypterus senegalus]|nr:ARL8A protein [Polypterus senegalus]
MIALFNKLLDWFKALFWKEEMELTLVGLQYSGKTTFVNVIAVLVLGNKRDLPGALDEKELIERIFFTANADWESPVLLAVANSRIVMSTFHGLGADKN